MKFSERWLRTLVDPPLDSAALCDRLTMAGLEVEAAVPAAPPFSRVVVAKIETVEPHPNADRLRVCTVDAGTGAHLTIVCGAPNAAAGMKAPCALVGAELPGGLAIRADRDARRRIAGDAVLGQGTRHRRRCVRTALAARRRAHRCERARRTCARRHADHVEAHAQSRRLPLAAGHRARGGGCHRLRRSPCPPMHRRRSHQPCVAMSGSRTSRRARAS